MGRLWLLGFAVLLMVACQRGQAQVSLLEAVHVAEIYVDNVVASWSIEDYAGEEHYRMALMDEGKEKAVWVHRDHGRVTQITQWNDEQDEEEILYHWPGIRVVAHRGGAGMAIPENTLPAIEKAIEVGAQLIEIDIRQTKDGHLILMHDTTIDRTTNGSGLVSEMTLDEIRELDAGSWAAGQFRATRVPTLKEALEAMKGRIDPDLDFKEGSVEKLVEVVQAVGIAEQCTMHTNLERSIAIANAEPAIFIRPGFSYLYDIPRVIEQGKAPLINKNWGEVSEEAIRITHINGSRSFVNTLGAADTLLYAEMAARAGADYIQTDYPHKVIPLLEEMGLMYDAEKDIGERINPHTGSY